MAPRLAHKKSRRGCLCCKERKVKCGEEWPSCAACLRHDVPCEYAEDPRISQHESARATSESDDTTKTSPPELEVPYSHSIGADLDLPDGRRQAVELYLLHRFKSSVAPAFSTGNISELEDFWNWDCVDLAFDFPYLINAMYAITCLYIGITSSYPRQEGECKPLPASMRDADYQQLHRMYLNLSICQQRDALEVLNVENADAVGLTAFLHSTMATCLLSDGDADCQYTPPIQWLTMHASIAAIFQESGPLLKPTGAMGRYTTLTQIYRYVDPVTTCNPEDIGPFQRLIGFHDATDVMAGEEMDPSIQEAYVKAVACIGGIYKAVLQAEGRYMLCMRVIGFGLLVPHVFIRLLAARRPRALAILANYMSFVRYIDQYWWFRARAETEVLGIRQILPPQWHWALRWPLAVLEEPAKISLDPSVFLEHVA